MNQSKTDREYLQAIAKKLEGIHIEELTTAETDICGMLMMTGDLKYNSEFEEYQLKEKD